MKYSRIYRLFKAGNRDTAADLYFKICIALSKEKAVQRYPQFTKQINRFIENDPSGNLKYLEWQLKILDSGQALENELIDIVNLFHKYNQRLIRRDLYSYKPHEVATLRDHLFTIKEEREQKHEKKVDKYKVELDEVSCGSSTVFEDDTVKVLLITNKAASVHHGMDTQWCIRLKDREYFEDYDANNVVFFFIISKILDKNDELHKVALSYERDSDNQIIKMDAWYANDSQKTESECIRDMLRAGVDNILEIFNLTRDIAKKQPKSMLAKLNSGDMSWEEAIELYRKEKNPKIRVRLVPMFAYKDSISPEELLPLHDQETDAEAKRMLAEAIAFSSTDENLLRDFQRKYPDLDVLYTNMNTPLDVIIAGTKSEDNSIRNLSLFNKRLPISILMELIDTDTDARKALAVRFDTPAEILLKLAADPATHTGLTQNRNTPTAALAKIIAYEEGKRGYPSGKDLVRHPNMSVELLYKFMDGGENGEAIRRLLELTGKDYVTFATLSREKKLDLKQAEFSVANPDGVDPGELHYLRRYVARDSKNEGLLYKLLNLSASDFVNGANGKRSLESALTENPNLPLPIIEELFPTHASELASHPNLTLSLVKRLVDSDTPHLFRVENALKNSALSSDSLEIILNKIINTNRDYGRQYSINSTAAKLLEHPSMTDELFNKFYDWVIQEKRDNSILNKLISLPNTPERIIENISQTAKDTVIKENANRRLQGDL